MGSRRLSLTDEQKADRKRWFALYVICVGAMMMVVDETIVGVALPTIKKDLLFTQASLSWVVNSYLITLGGLLLLAGRLGDIFGKGRLFRIGVAGFTVSSLICGVSFTRGMLLTGRFAQGITAAILFAVALSLVFELFESARERTKAVNMYGLILSAGAGFGVVLGGVITSALSWHWIFLVNVPVGIGVLITSRGLLPVQKSSSGKHGQLDVAGALAITASLMLAVYAIVNADSTGWTSTQTVLLLGISVALLATFLLIESRVREPLLPLSIFRIGNVAAANAIRVLFNSSLYSFIFLLALYLQFVNGYDPLQVGLALLPCSLTWSFVVYTISGKVVQRLGIKPPLVFGLVGFALGTFLLAQAPVHGSFVADVLPATLVMGFGGGIAYGPLLLAGMNSVNPERFGVASGLLNTTGMMGGALGLAVLASISASRTNAALASGSGGLSALNAGYHSAFLVSSILSLCAAVVAGLLISPSPAALSAEEGDHVVHPAKGKGDHVVVSAKVEGDHVVHPAKAEEDHVARPATVEAAELE